MRNIKRNGERFPPLSGRSRKAVAFSLLALLVLSMVSLTPPDSATGQVGDTALFHDLPEENLSPPLGFQGYSRSRLVEVDLALLGRGDGKGIQSGKILTLNLFPKVSFVAEPYKIESSTPGKITWQGIIAGEHGGTATFALSGEAVAGSVRVAGKLYLLHYLGDGRHLISEAGSFEPMPEYPPVVVPAAEESGEVSPSSNSGQARDSNESVESDDGSVIDVLVVYTPAARNSRGGTNGIKALIDTAVAETNQAYINSQIITRLNLVQAAEVNYGESGDILTDLTRLQNKSDGYMDEVHGWREAYDADMVSLINVDTGFCGIAYLMTGLSHEFEAFAFSVVHVECASGYYSFAHELGHNMGSAHDRANAGVALFDFSFGYQAPNSSFRTIMAYNCSGGCPRIQHFSNPWVNYGGQPTGIDYNSNPANSADNARSINDARFTVANWRVSSPPLPDPPLAPDTLAANPASFYEINLSWHNNAGNADGLILERRKTGGNWRINALLPASQSSYVDHPLGSQSSYDYRLRAYNLGGNSGYSNIASATTFPAPNSLFVPLLIR